MTVKRWRRYLKEAMMMMMMIMLMEAKVMQVTIVMKWMQKKNWRKKSRLTIATRRML